MPASGNVRVHIHKHTLDTPKKKEKDMPIIIEGTIEGKWSLRESNRSSFEFKEQDFSLFIQI